MCGKQIFLFLLKRTLLTFVCSVSSTTTIKEESDTAFVRAEYSIYMGFKNRFSFYFSEMFMIGLILKENRTGAGQMHCLQMPPLFAVLYT